MTISSDSAPRSNSKNASASGHSSFACLFRVILAAGSLMWANVPLTSSAQAPSPSSPPKAPPVQSTPAVSAPQVSTNSVSAPSGYTLSPSDQVAVEVFGEEDLRTNGRLSSDGNLSLPLLGSVRLAGLTLSQAAAKLTELYGRDYLVSPKVNVTLASYAKRRFTMLGQINRPGSYEMPEGSAGGIDLLEAVAMAGGYTRIAAPERITVRRRDQVMKINGKQIARGNAANAFKVEPGDTITVGESIF